MRITVNPDVAAAGGGILWGKGRTQLRIRGIEEQTSKERGLPMLSIEFEPTDAITDSDGNTVDAQSAGRIWDRVMVEPITTKRGQTISFLRPLIEACGLTWGGELDTEQLVGKELTARVGIEEYEGRERNTITGYVKA